MEGNIYCLRSAELFYIGSTTNNLQQRLKEHINDANRRNVGSKYIIETGDYEINLVEKCLSENLKKREGEIIKHFKELYGEMCVNKVINVRRTKEEKYNYHSTYRNTNKELLKEYAKQIIDCECGFSIQICEKARHKKSKRHLDNIK